MTRAFQPWHGSALLAVLCAAGVVAAMTWGPPAHRFAIGYAGGILVALFAAWRLACLVWRPHADRDHAHWRMIVWGLLAFAALLGFRLLTLLLPERTPSPAVGFVLFLLAHVPLWVGMINYPGRYPRAWVAWPALLCDMLLALGAVGMLAYLSSLHDILLRPHVAGALAVARWGYALIVLLGLALLILLLGKAPPSRLRGPRALLIFSLALLVGGDAALAYLSLTGVPLPRLMIGLWMAACWLPAIAAGYESAREARAAGPMVEPEEAPAYGGLLLSLLLPATAVALLFRQASAGDADLRAAVLILAAVSALLALRLLLLLGQGQRQYRALWHDYLQRERLILTDPLTGVANQRCLLARLEEEVSRAKRYSRPFAVIFSDLDFFKMVNDVHGHHAGDRVLCTVADTLHKAIRVTDVIARYGGEEFVLVLPETTLAQAGMLADRLREKVKALNIPVGHGNNVQVTISCGVSAYPESADSIESLLVTADEAMNEAKETGRDRVVLSTARQRLFVTSP